VLFTIHYQDWCFLLKGNVSYFRHIIHTDKALISDSKEKIIREQYEKELKMIHAVDHLICLADFTKKLLLEEYGIEERKISLIYNGLKDKAKIISEKERKQLKKNLYIDDKTKIILFVGRLREIKGVEFLIRAFKLVLQEHPNTHLVIAGSGNFSTYLKEAKGIWHKITFTGFIEKEDLLPISKKKWKGIVNKLKLNKLLYMLGNIIK
jgi:glycosyltransferase involved in cell wall biosynthesis